MQSATNYDAVVIKALSTHLMNIKSGIIVPIKSKQKKIDIVHDIGTE